MSIREIEVVVTGQPGSGAQAAAHAAARALEAVGVSVDLHSPVSAAELSIDSLRGVRATIRVVGTQGYLQPTLAQAPSQGPADPGGAAQVLKVGIGLVLLLVLFGAEVRLRFGLRLDTIVTLIGIWIFWHYCLRSRKSVASS